MHQHFLFLVLYSYIFISSLIILNRSFTRSQQFVPIVTRYPIIPTITNWRDGYCYETPCSETKTRQLCFVLKRLDPDMAFQLNLMRLLCFTITHLMFSKQDSSVQCISRGWYIEYMSWRHNQLFLLMSKNNSCYCWN